MKQLHTPKPCAVLKERDGSLVAVRFDNKPWTVKGTLETWSWRGEWWRTPTLEGDRRTYHRLMTVKGEIVVFEHASGFYVSGWWD